jgi:hypothetical protein
MATRPDTETASARLQRLQAERDARGVVGPGAAVPAWPAPIAVCLAATEACLLSLPAVEGQPSAARRASRRRKGVASMK